MCDSLLIITGFVAVVWAFLTRNYTRNYRRLQSSKALLSMRQLASPCLYIMMTTSKSRPISLLMLGSIRLWLGLR